MQCSRKVLRFYKGGSSNSGAPRLNVRFGRTGAYTDLSYAKLGLAFLVPAFNVVPKVF